MNSLERRQNIALIISTTHHAFKLQFQWNVGQTPNKTRQCFAESALKQQWYDLDEYWGVLDWNKLGIDVQLFNNNTRSIKIVVY